MKQSTYYSAQGLRMHQKALLITSIILIILNLFGCSHKVYVPVEKVKTTTVTHTDTLIQVQLQVHHDTVTVQPEAGEDTASYLHNPYAYSYARWKDGKLNHSLGIFPHVEIPARIPIIRVAESEKIPHIVEVERKLTLWQQMKLRTWAPLCAGIILLLAYFLHHTGVLKFIGRIFIR